MAWPRSPAILGVSWLCVGFAVWMWTFYKGAVAGFGSRKEEYVDKLGDPKSLFWKVRQFIALLPLEFRPVGYKRKPRRAAHAYLQPGEWRGDRRRGRRQHRGAATAPRSTSRTNRPSTNGPRRFDAALSQTSNCKIDVSTPNGNGGPFYRKRFGGKFEVFTFNWRDDPRKDDAWYHTQCAKNDSVIVAQEIDINYDASVTNSWIPGDTVNHAMGRGPADVEAVGGIRVGIDVARFGGDKSVITFRRGRVLIKQEVRSGLDTEQLAALAKTEIDAYSVRPEQIAVDTIGIGAGVADKLRVWYGELVADVNSSLRMSDGQNYNLRAFMWRQMKDWVAAGASLPNDGDLKAELTALRYAYRGGELLIESKDDAKKRGIKSPDRADSLALTFAIPGSAAFSQPITYPSLGTF